MRNFVIVIVVGLVGWWGYSNWWGTVLGSVGPDGTSGDPGVHAPGENLAGAGKDAPLDPKVSRVGNEAQAESRRLIQALRAQNYAGVRVDAGLQSQLLGNPAALYALEVGLALQRADGPSADLVHRADALGADSLGANALRADAESDPLTDGPELLCSGMLTLLKQNRLEAALEALGTENGFLMTQNAKTSNKALQAYLDTMVGQDREEAALYLSSLVTRMTRGRDVWGGSRFLALQKAVAALYEAMDQVLLSPQGAWRSSYMTIRKGDSLSRIANRFENENGIPIAPGLIQLINDIPNANRIHAGKRLRIPTERMAVVVSKRSYTMRIYLGDLLIRVYQVGIGKKGHETPLGAYTVIEKQLDPDWYRPGGGVIPASDPRNLLGKYFIKLDHPTFQGFGIHGTKKQETVGKCSSLGCIRVRNMDMDQVFAIIPRRTQVKVED